MRRNLLFYAALSMWLIWLFQSQFFEVATAVTLIYFLITWEEEETQNTSYKSQVKKDEDSNASHLGTRSKSEEDNKLV